MPEWWEYVIVVLFAETALVALSVTLPQTWLFFRLWRKRSSIAPYTLKTLGWTGAVGLALGWRCLVFWDTLFMEQRYLGTLAQRWLIELFLALFLVVAVNFAAGLYHWTITLRHGKRGTTGIPRRPMQRS